MYVFLGQAQHNNYSPFLQAKRQRQKYKFEIYRGNCLST